MTGLTYPYTKYDRILGDNLADDLELNPKTTPPSGTAGGAGRYKWWADTTNPLGASLRQATAERATAGFYVAAEWLTWGTIDIAARKFHFNTDGVDFTEGTGPLIVHDLNVTGITNLNTLNVSGVSSLHTTTITGNLTVSGTTTTGTLAVTNNATVGGALTVTGAITGGSLNTAGAISGASLSVSGAISGASLTISGAANIGSINTGSLTGLASLSVSGAINAGSLTVGGGIISGSLSTGAITSTSETTGTLHVTGTSDFDGAVNMDGALTVAGLLTAGSLHILGASDFDGSVNIDGDLTAHHIIAETITLTGVTPDVDIHTQDIFCRNITTTGDVVVGHNFQVVGECLPLVVGNTRVGVNGISYQTFDTRTDPTHGFRLTAFDLAFSIQPTGTGGGYPNLDVWFNNGYVFTINAFYSDPRTKTNIQLSDTDALSLIRQVKTYEFDQYGNHVELGVMGDQIGPLIPNSVMIGPSHNAPIPDLMQINVATMITYMLRSIQQLDTADTAFAPKASPVFTGIVTIPAGASIAGYAPLVSPAITGTPTAPTAPSSTATNQLATTAFVRNGTTTNDNAMAGQVGEFQFAQLLSTAAVALTNGVDGSITTLTLTPGDWEINSSVGFNTTNPNNMTLKAWINVTGATAAPSVDQVGGQTIQAIPNSSTQTILPTTSLRLTLSATTTIRLGATETGGGTVTAFGKIMARRMR